MKVQVDRLKGFRLKVGILTPTSQKLQPFPAGCSKRLSSKAADESKPEEVPTALRGAVRPYKWILANGKTPPVLPPQRISIGTLRISMS